MDGLGIYIHIPLCIKKCSYCDFCSYTDLNNDMFDAYTYELCRRIKNFASGQHSKRCVETVYFGGGTPTLLPIRCFEKIMGTVYECFNIVPDAEITVECNPASISFEGLSGLKALGINRLSIGMQSANDNELRALGRVHTFKDLCDIYADSRRAGFHNISLDLMYGIPEQTPDSFENTLNEVCRLSPEHISAYGLKIEDGTLFSKTRDSLILPDEDEEYHMYSRCVEILEHNGYGRYEISNFSRPDRESRHNLRYWTLKDYIGFGVAAHSCVEGERFGNSRNIKAFIEGKDITEERYAISEEERRREYVMLGLRLERGIALKEYRQRWGSDFKSDFPDTDRFIVGGFFKEKNGSVAFTTKGFFVSNSILSQMLDFE